MANTFHSVTLISEWCKGCTNCIKRCPTEAIRVRDGKAEIMTKRCIDCGECIRICPHHAKKAVYDDMSVLEKFKYKIALPAPSLYGQFSKLTSIESLDEAILSLGFDEVFEVSRAAELVSDATAKYIEQGGYHKPIISSACPTITRLIQIRFPDLIDHILPILTPVELAGLMAKKEAVRKTGLAPSEIGAIFISPCPAKVTAVRNPIGMDKSHLDGAIAIKEIYPLLITALNKNIPTSGHAQSGQMGLGWGCSGGEASAMLDERYLAADGIENCIRVLESLENENLNVEFIELNACPGGCVGGVLTVENPFISMVKLKSLRKHLPVICNQLGEPHVPGYMQWTKSVDYQPVLELDSDISSAMEKLAEIDSITEKLMGLDCGSCGAPSCRAFAEDIVRGYSSINDCVFVLRESMHNIAQTLASLSSWDQDRYKK